MMKATTTTGAADTQLTPYDLSLDGTKTLKGQVADGATTVEVANLSATKYVR